jgi:membrane-associated phospholipid phosphatase
VIRLIPVVINVRWFARFPAVELLFLYVLVALLFAAARLARGDGTPWVVAAYGALLATIALTGRWGGSSKPARVVHRWLPLLALPILYAAVPGTMLTPEMRDAAVQQADRILFHADIARSLAGAFPSQWISELLHAAYLSYYAIIYLPPALMHLRGDIEVFDRTILGFTIAMVGCFAVFCLYPVEGPRYAWPAPAAVPDGPIRSVALEILNRGSSRGTAFPSSHQAIAVVMSLSSLTWNRWWGMSLLVLTVLLGVGAVYGGFHYATDMVVGAGVGCVAWWAARRSKRRLVAPA